MSPLWLFLSKGEYGNPLEHMCDVQLIYCPCQYLFRCNIQLKWTSAGQHSQAIAYMPTKRGKSGMTYRYVVHTLVEVEFSSWRSSLILTSALAQLMLMASWVNSGRLKLQGNDSLVGRNSLEKQGQFYSVCHHSFVWLHTHCWQFFSTSHWAVIELGAFFILGDRKPLGICTFSHSFEEWACIILETGIDHGREIDDWHLILSWRWFSFESLVVLIWDWGLQEWPEPLVASVKEIFTFCLP